jgi:hypothetical protein
MNLRENGQNSAAIEIFLSPLKYLNSSSMSATPCRSSRQKRISLSPRKPKPRPRVSDPYPVPQLVHEDLDVANDEPEEVAFHTDKTFFDQQTNQFKLIQPEEIDQLFTSLREHFPGVIGVMPVLPFLIIECNPLPDLEAAIYDSRSRGSIYERGRPIPIWRRFYRRGI